MPGETLDFLTCEEILTPSRDEAINSSASQLTALQDEQMIEHIHWLNGEFVFAAHGGHANIVIPKNFTGWSWMRKSGGFLVYPHTTLSADVAAGAASFALSSATNWDSTGRSAIETTRNALDIVDHVSKASSTLTVSTATGAETVSIRHVSGNRVHKMYPLASDFARMHQLWVNSVPYQPEPFALQFPRYQRYAIYGSYILLPRGMPTADASYLYEKAPSEITELTSETNIPRRFLRWAVNMTLHHLFTVRRKRGDTLPALQLAEMELQKAINYDSVQSSSTQIRLA